MARSLVARSISSALARARKVSSTSQPLSPAEELAQHLTALLGQVAAALDDAANLAGFDAGYVAGGDQLGELGRLADDWRLALASGRDGRQELLSLVAWYAALLREYEPREWAEEPTLCLCGRVDCPQCRARRHVSFCDETLDTRPACRLPGCSYCQLPLPLT